MQTVFLDYYYKGKRRKEYLTALTLKPANCPENRAYNKNIKLQAEKLRTQREEEILNNSLGDITAKSERYKDMPLLDYMDQFMAWKKAKGQSKSIAITINNLILHLQAFRGEEVTMEEVDKKFCNDFIDYLANAKAFGRNKVNRETHERKPLAKSTAKLYYDTFVCALNKAAREGIIVNNPANLIDREDKNPIKPKGNERDYLTADEVKKLIKTPYCNQEVKTSFLFGCFCGLRISDVRALKWSNVHQDGKRKFISITMKKTGQTIIVPLSKNALKWMPERGDSKDSDLVFPKLPHNNTINFDLKGWMKRAGIEKRVCFHVSRHTFATLTLESGADIAEVSSLLGHKNIRTTQIYAKVVDRKKIEAMNKLDKMFE